MCGRDPRRARWLQIALVSAGVVCVVSPCVSCTDGVAQPLVLSPEFAADGGGDDEPAYEPMLPRGGSGGSRTDEDVCDALEAAWPSDPEEGRLVVALNKLRTMPGPVCSVTPPTRPLEVREEMECLARLRLKAEMPARTGNSPEFDLPDLYGDAREESALRARIQKADIDPEDVGLLSELVITNAPTAESVADAFAANALVVCGTAYPLLRLVGVAHTGHAWVVTFGTLRGFGGRGPGGR